MGNSKHTYTTSLFLRNVFIICISLFSVLPGVWTQNPVLFLDDFVNENNCTQHSKDMVMVEGFVNLTGVVAEDWSNAVEFVVQDGDGSSASSVLCQATLLNCSSQSVLGCYCKARNDSLFIVVLNQTADVQYSRKMVQTRFTDINLSTAITSTETPYPYVSEAITGNLTFGNYFEAPPLTGTVLNIPINDQEIHFAISGLSEPYTISIMIPRKTIENTNQPTVSAFVNESNSNVTLSYKEHGSCQRERSYFYILKDVWRQEPQLFIGNFDNVSSCVKAGQDIGVLEATFDNTGVDESHWFRLLSFAVGDDQIFPTCSAVLDFSSCPPTGYSSLTCYCKERRDHVYTVIFNQSAVLSYSEKDVKLRAYRLTTNNDQSFIESNKSITYPLVSKNLDVILAYGNENEAQFPPINNSVIDIPDDNQVIEFIVDGMRDPSSISYRLSSPDITKTFINQTTVNITVFDITNYITISYQEELHCQRSATYEFTLKATTRSEPTLTISSIESKSVCPSAGKGVFIIEGVVDFTGVDYSQWILEVYFFTPLNQSLCTVSLQNCGETIASRCYCKSYLKDVYTVVFNDTMDPVLSLQKINLGASRKNSSTIEADEAADYPLSDYTINATMAYGNQTQSPPTNNSMIYIPDDRQVIQFTVHGLFHPSSISYKLSSPDHGYTFVNQNSVNITIYDSTNYITIWYEDFCERSATYHFTLKAVDREDPTLTVGPVTGSQECVLAGESMVTFESVVDFTGVDYSQWVLILFFETPASDFMVCSVSLVDCGEMFSSCYCKGHVRDVYTLVFNETADIVHSLQPVSLTAIRSNLSNLVADETAGYPFVNQDINVTMTYGNQPSSPPINNSVIYVPDDNQVIQVTVTGMRHPSSISYRLSSPDQEMKVENQSSVNITVNDSTNNITIWYEEKEYCRRSASYTFTLKGVWREEPQMVTGALESVGTSCPIHGQDLFTLESTLNFTGVDDSQWLPSVDFVSSTSDDVICTVPLIECQPTSHHSCYCKDLKDEIYTVVFNVMANSSLNGVLTHLVAYKKDISSVLKSEAVEYPFASDNIEITVKYANRAQKPLTNNSVQEIHDDDSIVNFIVNGLSLPYTIKYVKSADPDNVVSVINQSTIAVPVSETRLTVSYLEAQHCQRGKTYIYSLEDDSSDGLSTPVIIAIAIGSLVIVVFFIAIIVAIFNKDCLCKTRKRTTRSTADRYVVESSTTHF